MNRSRLADGIRNPFKLFSFLKVIHRREIRFTGHFTRLIGSVTERGTGGGERMAHWLMKSEPESYSWSDLVRDGGTEWDGVRNNAARLHLKAMKKGDEAFFYHSMSDKAVVGIMRIAREAQPDPKDAGWVSVRVEPVRRDRPGYAREIKAEPRLSKMELIRQSRLSVAPVREDEWMMVQELAKGP